MTQIQVDFKRVSQALNAWRNVMQSEQVTEEAKEKLTEAASNYEQALSFHLKKVF